MSACMSVCLLLCVWLCRVQTSFYLFRSMASASDGVGGCGKGGGAAAAAEVGGERPLHRMLRLQPVFEMPCSITPSSIERRLSNHGGTFLYRDVNRLVIVESADEEMRFIDDVTDSDSIDDDVMTKTQADSVDRDDEYQRSAQVSSFTERCNQIGALLERKY